MSRPMVRDDRAADVARLRTGALPPTGVRFGRRHGPARVSAAGTADAIRLIPDTRNRDALRAASPSGHARSGHICSGDPRFGNGPCRSASGRGSSVSHAEGKVDDAHRAAGELIPVPTGTRHRFDAGDHRADRRPAR